MRVLLAYDGGDTGERALQVIAPWAQRSGAELHVIQVLKPNEIHDTVRPATLHVLTPSAGPTGTVLYAEEPPAVLAEDRSQALDAARATAADEMEVLIAKYAESQLSHVHVVVGANVAREIASLAAAIGADLVAVGAHGRTGVSHAVFGSVAESVVRQSTVPVVVVGPAVI